MNESLRPIAPGKTYHFADAANTSSFKLKPLTVALDELRESIVNDANDDTARAPVCKVEFSPGALIEWVYTTILGPVDKPNELIAFEGFHFGIESLCQEFFPLIPLSKAIREVRVSQIFNYVSATVTDRPLQGRRTAYMEYELCLEIGSAAGKYPELLAAIASAELLLSRLKGRRPDRRLLSKCRITNPELVSKDPENASQSKWKLKSQRACLLYLKNEIAIHARKNQNASAALGIVISEEQLTAPVSDPAKEFNKALKNRWTASSDHMPIRDRQGATPLRPAIVKEIGGNIRDSADQGDALAAIEYFEIHFNITPPLVHKIPILMAGDIPSTWLSLDIDNEVLYVGNDWLLKTGAKPPPGTELLYLATLNFFPVHIPPFIGGFLKRQRAALANCLGNELGQLLKRATHQPKQNLFGTNSSPGLTVHKIRRAACTNLVQMGHSRSVVSNVTCQNGYISPGRGYYSCITSKMLREATQTFFRSFDWLGGFETLKGDNFLVGSRVTPKPESIQAVFRIITGQVNRTDAEFNSNPDFTNWLLRHHAICSYFSLGMETGLCYRNKEAFDFSHFEIVTNEVQFHINDKKVRSFGGPAVNKPEFVSMVTRGFISYIENATSFLIQSAQSCDAARKIVNTLGLANAQDPSTYPIVNFDIHGQTVQIGTSDWHKSLPPTFRLVENFARHFWPLAALENGLNQVHLDYLLRHQLNGAEHETDQDPKSSATVRHELVTVINRVLGALCLEIPAIFTRENTND